MCFDAFFGTTFLICYGWGINYLPSAQGLSIHTYNVKLRHYGIFINHEKAYICDCN